jgi:hypothetical protein
VSCLFALCINSVVWCHFFSEDLGDDLAQMEFNVSLIPFVCSWPRQVFQEMLEIFSEENNQQMARELLMLVSI